MQAQPFSFPLVQYTNMKQASLVQQLGTLLTARRWLLGTAESCTGGGVASACTDFSGSSYWFSGGIVSYSNELKSTLLNVPPQLLLSEGAVSTPCAAAMANGALQRLAAQIAVSTTGVAGPGGGSVTKPVGMVCFGLACGSDVYADIQYFCGDRTQVRERTVHHALAMLVCYLSEM